MTTFEALLYRATYELARRTVVGVVNSEDVLAGAWRGLAEGYRAGRELIKARTTESTPEREPKPTRRARKS